MSSPLVCRNLPPSPNPPTPCPSSSFPPNPLHIRDQPAPARLFANPRPDHPPPFLQIRDFSNHPPRHHIFRPVIGLKPCVGDCFSRSVSATRCSRAHVR